MATGSFSSTATEDRSATQSSHRINERRQSWRYGAPGAESRSVQLAYNSELPGKPLPLIAWVDAHEPESLKRADHALFCRDYLRFRLTGEIGLEISDMSSAALVDLRLRR